MKTYTTSESISNFIIAQKELQKTVGFVPTMGALHTGHLELIKKSTQENEITVVSIFVNPTQFNNVSDLEKYPRVLEKDILLLEHIKCDILFYPTIEEMYPNTKEVWHYNPGLMAEILEGKYRPGHFKGVTQIVYKLFNAVPANRAYFGKKDYQQYLIIKKLVKDFNLPIEVIGCDIVRENDGLAYSSRNVHLSSDERSRALSLSKALTVIKNGWLKKPIFEVYNEAITILNEAEIILDYLEIRNVDTLLPINNEKIAIVLIAAQVGNTRLIDNMMLG